MSRFLLTGGSGFIGTNFSEMLNSKGIEFINIDIAPPLNEAYIKNWIKEDILNLESLLKQVEKFNPTHIIHLAAVTSCAPNLTMEDYLTNTEGTKNVIEAAKQLTSLTAIVFTSSQYVHYPNSIPKNDTDFKPHTVYGESKVIGEKMVRHSNLTAKWVIIRPTNIWGEWHQRYKNEFWRVLQKGFYIHPRSNAVRAYGYIRNVNNQIYELLTNPIIPSKSVFYVGDTPIKMFDWVNLFSIGLTGKKVKQVPRQVLYVLALAGEVLKLIGIKEPPMRLTRYRNMISSDNAPMEKTLELVGAPQYSISEGVHNTVKWIKHQA